MLKDSSHTKINCHMIAQLPHPANGALLELCSMHLGTPHAQGQGLGGKSRPCFQSKPNMSLSVTRPQSTQKSLPAAGRDGLLFQRFPRHRETRIFKKIVKLCCCI